MKCLIAAAMILLLGGCGGGSSGLGPDSCSDSPRINSHPPTTATVGQPYRYLVDWVHCLFCVAILPVRLPPGASVSGSVISWAPTANDINRDVSFGIRTPSNFCGDSDGQSWVVHVYPDFTPPKVTSTSPGNGETGFSVISSIATTFSQAVKSNSINSSSFLVSGPSGPVAGNLTVSGNRVTFSPNPFLEGLTVYTVTITTAVKNLSDIPLPSNVVWTFTTGVAPDKSAPTIPSGLVATPITASEIDLSWSPSIDNESVAGYKIYKNGSYLKSVLSITSVSSTGLEFKTQSCYTILAYDSSGNESQQSNSACATTPDLLPGQVANWGYGGIPDGFEIKVTSPEVLRNLSDVVSIAGQGSGVGMAIAGGMAIRSDGNLWSTSIGGAFPYGGVNNITAISVGAEHFIALKSDRTVLAWGNNNFGQLGDGTRVENFTPIQVANLRDIVAIAAGQAHSLALKSDGTVWAWGYDLGVARTTPVQVANLDNVIAIAAGWGYSLALKSDGTVWSWGMGEFGTLGDGTNIDKAAPVQVLTVGSTLAIAAGMQQALALGADGTVWTWGDNASGFLGDGTMIDHNSPVQVLHLTNVKAIAASPVALHVLALKTDGTVWAWGTNFYGALGDGTTIPRDSPVQVLGLSNISAIAVGNGYSMALR